MLPLRGWGRKPEVRLATGSRSVMTFPSVPSHFKGWAKPGPVPPGAATRPDVPADESLDALSGHFRIYQLRGGHRFSTDDLLTAWYGTTCAPSAASILD